MFGRISRRLSTGSFSNKKAKSDNSDQVHAFVHDLNKSMGITAKDKTLVITNVEKYGEADRGGVQVGDIVTSIGGVDVKNIGEIKTALMNCKNRGDREVVVCCANGALRGRQSWDKHEKLHDESKQKRNVELFELISSAEIGDAVAQHKLGMAYSKGTLGLDQDNEQAVKWWRASVSQGLIDAQISLGIALFTGLVDSSNKRKVDYEGALELWQAASAKGSAEAMTNIACMHLEGRGVPRNAEKAVELLKQAGSDGRGDIQADLVLAIILEKGMAGIPKDIKKSNELFDNVNSIKSNGNTKDGNGSFNEMLMKHRRASAPASVSIPSSQGDASLSFRFSTVIQSPEHAQQRLRVSSMAANVAQQEAERDAAQAKKSEHLEELAEQRAASIAAAKESRAEKERKRQERIRITAERVNEESMARADVEEESEEVLRPESLKHLKEAMAEGLQKIVYMNATVLFNILDTERTHELTCHELANGFKKFTEYHVTSEDDVVQQVLEELDVDGKGFVTAGDMKDRWHVLAGGHARSMSAARRRASHQHHQNNF